MSNWTKIFIILLSAAAIFLSAAVTVFVGSTENYKAEFATQTDRIRNLERDASDFYQTMEEKTFLVKELEKKYVARIAQIESEMQNLIEDKRTAETKLNEATAKVSAWSGTVAGFETTIANLNQTLILTETQLKDLRSKGIKDDSKLAELEGRLYEKIVQMKQLDSDLRNLREQKKSIEDRLASLTGTGVDHSRRAVTTTRNKAMPARRIPAGSAVKGQIIGIGESLVTMNVGSSDGVTPGTVFYVIRGDMFICNIRVTDVDINECAGTSYRNTVQPKIGDSVSTKL